MLGNSSGSSHSDKVQGKLIKSMIGIGPRYRTTPLLQAVNMKKISDIIDVNNLMLLRRILLDDSAARSFII